MKVGIIGCGGMGGALARGLVAASQALPAGGVAVTAVAVCDHHPEKARAIAGAEVAPSAAAAASGADVVVLAVKPPAVPAALREALPSIAPDSLILSVAAGVRIATLAAEAPGRAIARAMPNVGASLGVGTTGVALGPAADPVRDRERATAIFSSVGLVRFVKNEADLHAVTALAGSGPAFVAVVLEAMIDAGLAAGLARDDASFYARGALRAASALVDVPGADPARIRADVTSPGGTTIAGLVALEQAGARSAFLQAIDAAVARSRVLGGE